MVRQVATRSQRRMEKKQAVILLGLVLVVSLVSFTLGVMVGRSGSRPAAVAVPQPARLPVAPPVPAPPPADATASDERRAETLTFYDSLSKGEESPLGSGINLPPARSKPEAADDSGEAARLDAADGTKATNGTVAEASLPPQAAAPVAKAAAPADAGGDYLVQAASFRNSEDARVLQAKLGQKGYAAFTEEAQLGEKGVWYRVYVGPVASTAAADAVVARLKAEEKLTALVRKR
jgi:cell division septation protein DedD